MRAAASSRAANFTKRERTMTQKKKMALGILAVMAMAMAGFTAAVSSQSPAPFKTWYTTVSLVSGSGEPYDFGYDSVAQEQIGVQPATYQIHTFILHRGAAVPWHYHKALSYVTIQSGTLGERHQNSDKTCSALETHSAGDGFSEPPEFVHEVVNVGQGDAVITWATAFPTSDPPLAIGPQFTVGGIYPVSAPCQ